MKINFTVLISLFALILISSCKQTPRQYDVPEIKVNEQQVRPNERVCTVSRTNFIKRDVYTSVDQLPEFPGGVKSFNKYIKRNLKYPKEANGAHGRVIVNFVVNQDGSLSNVEILGGRKHPALEKEALRIMKASPKWNPGKIDRKNVRVQYTVPIVFDKVK